MKKNYLNNDTMQQYIYHNVKQINDNNNSNGLIQQYFPTSNKINSLNTLENFTTSTPKPTPTLTPKPKTTSTPKPTPTSTPKPTPTSTPKPKTTQTKTQTPLLKPTPTPIPKAITKIISQNMTNISRPLKLLFPDIVKSRDELIPIQQIGTLTQYKLKPLVMIDTQLNPIIRSEPIVSTIIDDDTVYKNFKIVFGIFICIILLIIFVKIK